MPTANITEAGRRRRLTGGVVWLLVASLTAAAMRALHLPAAWDALLVVPFTLAALGYFQAKERT